MFCDFTFSYILHSTTVVMSGWPWVPWFSLHGYLATYVSLLLGSSFGFEDLLYSGGAYKIDTTIIYETIDEPLFNKRR